VIEKAAKFPENPSSAIATKLNAHLPAKKTINPYAAP
jgi:hypothetical protein